MRAHARPGLYENKISLVKKSAATKEKKSTTMPTRMRYTFIVIVIIMNRMGLGWEGGRRSGVTLRY